MYYAGTVWLRMDEETFWKTTPRKLFALIQVHLEMHQAQNGGGNTTTKNSQKSSQVPSGYIDQVNW